MSSHANGDAAAMPAQPSIDARIHALAAPTKSLVHARDLRAAGIGRPAIRARVAAGTMAVVIPRIYAVGPTCATPTYEQRCMAGLLARAGSSWLDGVAAARVLVDWDRSGDTVNVVVAGSVPNARYPGYRFHRRDPLWMPDRPLARDGLTTVGFVDMCRRLGVSLTPWQLAHVVDVGCHRGLTTLDDLRRCLECSGGGPGSRVLARAVELAGRRCAGTRSASEDRLLGDVLAEGAPEPLVNVRGACGLPHDEPDLFWATAGINVEVDGRHHELPAQRADDAVRDELVEARGIRVIRIPARLLWGRQRRRVARLVLRAVTGGAVATEPRTRRLVLQAQRAA